MSEIPLTRLRLHIRISLRKIKSDLSFTIPYSLRVWLCLEVVDIFNELQFILETDNVGNFSIWYMLAEIRNERLRRRIR